MAICPSPYPAPNPPHLPHCSNDFCSHFNLLGHLFSLSLSLYVCLSLGFFLSSPSLPLSPLPSSFPFPLPLSFTFLFNESLFKGRAAWPRLGIFIKQWPRIGSLEDKDMPCVPQPRIHFPREIANYRWNIWELSFPDNWLNSLLYALLRIYLLIALFFCIKDLSEEYQITEQYISCLFCWNLRRFLRIP